MGADNLNVMRRMVYEIKHDFDGQNSISAS